MPGADLDRSTGADCGRDRRGALWLFATSDRMVGKSPNLIRRWFCKTAILKSEPNLAIPETFVEISFKVEFLMVLSLGFSSKSICF